MMNTLTMFLGGSVFAVGAHQNRLSVRQVKGGFEGGEETGGNDVFVDEVGESHHPVFASCTTQRG